MRLALLLVGVVALLAHHALPPIMNIIAGLTEYPPAMAVVEVLTVLAYRTVVMNMIAG